jgi:hypothetical protein
MGRGHQSQRWSSRHGMSNWAWYFFF